MEKNKDYEKRLGIRLREAYLKDYEGPAMSREEFHRLVETAEKKKKHKRTLIGIAAACVTLCLVCGGFMAGVSMRESASAGKDDETKTVRQGNSVVIGSGVSGDDQNVGASTRTYTSIEDIPEDLQEQIRFLDSDEFELEKVKVGNTGKIQLIALYYKSKSGHEVVVKTEKANKQGKGQSIIPEVDKSFVYNNNTIFEEKCDEGRKYYFCYNGDIISVFASEDEKIEAILNDLISN